MVLPFIANHIFVGHAVIIMVHIVKFDLIDQLLRNPPTSTAQLESRVSLDWSSPFGLPAPDPHLLSSIMSRSEYCNLSVRPNKALCPLPDGTIVPATYADVLSRRALGENPLHLQRLHAGCELDPRPQPPVS